MSEVNPDYACPKCGTKDDWKWLDDDDNGDWVEAAYQCNSCNKIIYIELAD